MSIYDPERQFYGLRGLKRMEDSKTLQISFNHSIRRPRLASQIKTDLEKYGTIAPSSKKPSKMQKQCWLMPQN